MAFSDPLSLNNAAAVAKAFNRKSSGIGVSEAIEASSTSSDRTLMKIAHTKAGKGVAAGTTVDRHLLQFQRAKFNSAVGADELMTINVTLTVPSSSGLTTTDVNDLCAYVKNFLSTQANIDRLVRGESQ